jgi:hypothetical protein
MCCAVTHFFFAMAGTERKRWLAGDDMVVVPPQNWLIRRRILGDWNLLCSSKIEN